MLCVLGICVVFLRMRKKSSNSDRFSIGPTISNRQTYHTTNIDEDLNIPMVSNIKDVSKFDRINRENAIFQNGVYEACWYHINNDCRPFMMSLLFNNGTIAGRGIDDIGEFNVIGYFSMNDTSIVLKQTYISDTDDENENREGTIQINLKWNASEKLFVGHSTVGSISEAEKGENRFQLRLKTSDSSNSFNDSYFY